MKDLAIAAALLGVSACAPRDAANAETDTLGLSLIWRAEGLANPESVVLSSNGTELLVTNVNGEADARDGNGFISRLSLDGRVLQREWVTGLDGPKGIARRGDTLYVSDIDDLVVIDAVSGGVTARIALLGAEFLNDVAITDNGLALVSDSGAGRIYAVRDREVEVWSEGAHLQSVNGLLVERTRVVVTTMQGKFLAIDRATRAITTLAEGLGDADGVAPAGAGRYLVSEWPGVMHVVAPDGTHTSILDARGENFYLNDFLLVGDVLYQPHWEPSALSAYRLSGLE